jgi:hypothetical protein
MLESSLQYLYHHVVHGSRGVVWKAQLIKRLQHACADKTRVQVRVRRPNK